jgi:hypothetical protein
MTGFMKKTDIFHLEIGQVLFRILFPSVGVMDVIVMNVIGMMMNVHREIVDILEKFVKGLPSRLGLCDEALVLPCGDGHHRGLTFSRHYPLIFRSSEYICER